MTSQLHLQLNRCGFIIAAQQTDVISTAKYLYDLPVLNKSFDFSP
jgi:hypothetical protein